MTALPETARIADQLHRALHGPAWHGPALMEVLTPVTADQARARPIPDAHSIWEITVHTAAWIDLVRRRLAGEHVDGSNPEVDWPTVDGAGDEVWQGIQVRLAQAAQQLEAACRSLPDTRLDDDLPGLESTWTVYRTLHGVVQHVLYHAGQVAILRKAAAEWRAA